ncbi:hypothetical protein AYO44_14690 [Planctomycetaceae bacterium SCGC AG-212-F19]|nr:hypothetical protein AYO44_14690 [Planctomycetaceae bacterium SCGC AG-212-F19]
MPITFNCPGCGKGYSVPESVAGRATKCRACGTAVTIPLASEAAQVGFAAAPSFGSPAAAAPVAPSRSRGKIPFKLIGLTAAALLVLILIGGLGYALLGSSSPAGMAYMPDDCKMIISVRVAELYNSPAWAEVKKEFPEVEKPIQDAIKDGEMGPSDIPLMIIGFADVMKQEGIVAIQTKKPADLTKFHGKTGVKPTETKVAGYTVLEAPDVAACKLSDKLVLMGNPATLKAILERKKDVKFSDGLQKALKDADMSQGISIAVDVKGFASDPMIGGAAKQSGVDPTSVEYAVLNIAINKDININSITVCKDAKSADENRKMAEGGLIMVKKFAGDQMPKEVVDIIDGIKFTTKENRLTAEVTIKVTPIIKAIKPFVGQNANATFQQVGQPIGPGR